MVANHPSDSYIGCSVGITNHALFLYNVPVLDMCVSPLYIWLTARAEPIMLKVLMIMLCCTAQEMCQLCS